MTNFCKVMNMWKLVRNVVLPCLKCIKYIQSASQIKSGKNWLKYLLAQYIRRTALCIAKKEDDNDTITQQIFTASYHCDCLTTSIWHYLHEERDYTFKIIDSPSKWLTLYNDFKEAYLPILFTAQAWISCHAASR